MTMSAWAQGAGGTIPRFEEYAVATSVKELRTNLLLPKPNFAGRYAVIRWACGSKCLMAAILDVSTATVYNPPFSGNHPRFVVSMDPTSEMDLGFRLNSSLFVLQRACKPEHQDCGTYYFDWNVDHFDLITWTPSAAPADRAKGFSHLPRFDEYPVGKLYKGTPVLPKLRRPEERRFRTAIRNGIMAGKGVGDGETGHWVAGPGPNFAGKHTIVEWGCGTDCGEMAIVNAETGSIFQPPFAGSGRSYFWYPTRFSMRPQFRVESKLFIMPNICADNVPVCGTYYFVFEKSGWREIHREPLPPGIMQPFY